MELIDAFGVIWPIMLEVAFTATVVLLCDKILIIRGPLNFTDGLVIAKTCIFILD